MTKVERWKEETDEDWAERLAEEVALANNTEISRYFIESDPHAEDSIIINYIGELGFTWKEHPQGPFNAKQLLEWKAEAKMWEKDHDIMKKNYVDMVRIMEDWKNGAERLETQLKAVKGWCEHYSSLNPPYAHHGDLEALRRILEGETPVKEEDV